MNPRTGGFTLLEMIISMIIVSLIVLMIYSSYSMVVGTWDRSQEQIADFRLDVAGDRLLVKDWEAMRPYAFTVPGGSHRFLHGSPTRFAYVTRHGLGGVRRIDGGLFFTLLMIEPHGDGVGLFCYKTDLPELELFELVRLYGADGEGPRAMPLEADLRERSILLKEADAASFSYAAVSAGSGSDLDRYGEPLPLPLERWNGAQPPARVRFMALVGDDVEFLDGFLRREAGFGGGRGGP